MKSDELRSMLAQDSHEQPPVSDGFRSGINRRVRRHRLQAAMVGTPIVAVLVLSGALLMSRGTPETTVATAGDSGTTMPIPTTAAPSTTSVVVPTTEADAEDEDDDDNGQVEPDDDTPVPTTAPPASTEPVNGACGTVTLSTETKELTSAPFTCFIKALNADVPADLTVIVNMPDGGSITDHMTSQPGHLVTVAVDGSFAVKIPAIAFGGGGGGVVGSTDPTDCGTVTIDPGLSELGRHGDADDGDPSDIGGVLSAAMPPEMKCFVTAALKGGPASLAVVANGPKGGAITTSVKLDDAHVLTISMGGSMTVQLPNDFNVPEDLMSALPPNGLGLDQWTGGMGKKPR